MWQFFNEYFIDTPSLSLGCRRSNQTIELVVIQMLESTR